jgi:hypothetical protein
LFDKIRGILLHCKERNEVWEAGHGLQALLSVPVAAILHRDYNDLSPDPHVGVLRPMSPTRKTDANAELERIAVNQR